MPIVRVEPPFMDRNPLLPEETGGNRIPGDRVHAHTLRQGEFGQPGSQVTASEDDEVLPGESFRFHP